jgi:20S proteasome alpha/beta subunit
MTVGIAIICRENKESRIVACVDSRLDATYSSTDTAVKIVPVSANWIALLSGDDWKMATKMAESIKQCLSNEPPPFTSEAMFQLLRKAAKGFVKSPFRDKTRNVDLIVCGFSGDYPSLFLVGSRVGSPPYVMAGSDFAVIGSGDSIARTFLSLRGVNKNMSMDRAVYCAYEAKKYSENAPGVGPKTTIWISRPDGTCSTSGNGNIRALESARKKFGLKPFETPELPMWSDPKRYLLTGSTPPDPQHPTIDPSGPTPSPE